VLPCGVDGQAADAKYNPRENTVSKSTIEKASTTNAEFMFGGDTFKTGFDKTAKLCESVGEFNKDNLQAYIQSATVVGKSLQSAAQESSSYAKQAIEDAIAASKAMMNAKSISDVIELQTSFTKTAFSGYVRQLSRINDAFVATAKESAAPLQGRVEAAADLMKSAHA
jgi:phasin family protein